MAIRKIELRTYDTLCAIDAFQSYWQENERLILREVQARAATNRPSWTPETDEEHGEFAAEIEVATDFHNRYILQSFRYSSAVMLCVILERELIRLVGNLKKHDDEQKLDYKDLEGGFMEKILKYTRAFFDFHLDKCPGFSSIKDLQKVRNCIVHCHGELSLNKNSKSIKKLLELNKAPIDFYANQDGKIWLGEKCLEFFILEVRKFFLSIFRQLKWPVDSQPKKLPKR